mmetsp:Transcript_117132/g.213159  ORF Transcript_117132/g.213159 Transcript_117132/m.213159 type:complete len:151 (+) Transcript_117132:3-455(+)
MVSGARTYVQDRPVPLPFYYPQPYSAGPPERMPSRVYYQKIDRPRIVDYPFNYHDPAFGCHLRLHQPDLDWRDAELQMLEPDDQSPIDEMYEYYFKRKLEKDDEYRREHGFEELRHPLPLRNLQFPTHEKTWVSVTTEHDDAETFARWFS